MSKKRQAQRHFSIAHRIRHSGALILVLCSFLLLGNTPQIQILPKNQKIQLSEVQLAIYVVDILTKKPIPGAIITISGVKRLGIADANGRIVMQVPRSSKTLSVSVRHASYMGMTQTQIELATTPSLLLAMPPLQRLKEADALIRDPRTLDPRRKQTFLKELPAPHTSKATAINTPIVGVTYPLPKYVKVKKSDGSIITLALEEYLKGVLPREIGSSFPPEAMKAQAVAARTYTVQYILTHNKPICVTTTCQVWGTKQYAATSAAIKATAGQVIVYKGKIAGGYFAASCGGYTIDSEKKWSYRAYLRARPCIENKGNACSVVCKLSTCGGGRCSRSHPTCWGVFGHRIGLCQRGAQSMAKCGKTYVEIVKHYYTGVDIANMAATANPVDDAKFVRETIPSGSKFRSGSSFMKEWVLENTGNTTWTAGDKYQLARLDGTSFGAGSTIGLSSGTKIGPRQSHNFLINLKVPSQSGAYKARWQMQKNGKNFGPIITIEIIAEASPANCVDADKDGFPAAASGCPGPHDCDDNDKSIHPNAREICGNNKDDDCKDGDSKCPSTCIDADKDGYFAPNSQCPTPHDCDDNDKSIHPNAREICGNNKDDDCRGGDTKCPSDCEDKDKDGYGAGSGCPKPVDCNDNDKHVYPGAPEICGNGKDEDCREGDAVCTPNPKPKPKPKPGTKKKLGESGCVSHGECETNACVEFSGKRICTTKCTASNPSCPSGFVCMQRTACWPSGEVPKDSLECRINTDCKVGFVCNVGKCKEQTKKGCGCQTTRHSPQHPLMWLLVLGLFAWVLRRRRMAG